MEIDKTLVNETIKIEYWTPTLNLRWFEQALNTNVNTSYSLVRIKTLQQMYQGHLGSVEWRDVPTETES
ncbi:hypothetical protein SL053_002587 [Flavobacterium psychrophilum]|nr:hypothetical protein [Flavobacterium psychrophilum]